MWRWRSRIGHVDGDGVHDVAGTVLQAFGVGAGEQDVAEPVGVAYRRGDAVAGANADPDVGDAVASRGQVADAGQVSRGGRGEETDGGVVGSGRGEVGGAAERDVEQ